MTSASSVAVIEPGPDITASTCICLDFLAGSRRNIDFLVIDGLRPIGSAGSEVVRFSVSFFNLLAAINSSIRPYQASRMDMLGARRVYLLPECISYNIKPSPALSLSWVADSSCS